MGISELVMAALSGLGSVGSGIGAGLTAGGLSGGVAGGLGALGVGAGTAGALAPILTDAGLGAGLSALTGRNAGTGALLGGALGGLGELGGGSGVPAAGTASAATVPGYTTPVPGPNGTTTNLQTPGFSLSQPTLPGSTPASSATTLPGNNAQVAAGTGNTIQQLSALGQILGFSKPNTPSAGATYNQSLNPTGYINRTPTQGYQPSTGNWQTYGEAPEGNMFQGNQLNTQNFARGGGALSRRGTQSPARGRMPSLGGRPLSTEQGDHYVRGGSPGQEDNRNAKLSDGEYIMDAATMSRLGSGNNEAGARVMDRFRKKVAEHAGSDKVVPPKARRPEQYLRESMR